MKLYTLSAAETARGIKKGAFKAEDVLKSCLDRIKKYDGAINSVITLCEKSALDAARGIDARKAEGGELGPLGGVPFAVKDNFCTDGIETTCCSNMLRGWIPQYDATAVRLMKEAGAVLIGKTNMDEFAMGSTTESSVFGPTLNPRARERVPGGSSGGSAAAVAAGFCPIALGSDTGGSVREPAAFCGVHGMKPSYGQISRYGVIAYASSLDQVGILARTVEDMALVMDVIAKGDTNDTTCDAYERPAFSDFIKAGDLEGRKIAVLAGFDRDNADRPVIDAMERAVELCRRAGTEVAAVALPITIKHAAACYYMTALADASSKLACYDGMRYGLHADGRNLNEMYTQTRSMGFGAEVRRRIAIGTCILTKGYYENYFVPATKVRTLIVKEFEEAFKNADAVISPVVPSLPYKKGLVEDDPEKVYLGDALTSMANLAGIPAVSLNMGFTEEGLPVAVQLLGARFCDEELLSIASVLERAAGAPQAAELEKTGY